MSKNGTQTAIIKTAVAVGNVVNRHVIIIIRRLQRSRRSERKKLDMKTKISNKAGFALVEVMIVAAIIGVFATIAVCQMGTAHPQRPLEITQALTRLKWMWAAISISSTLAAFTFVWLRAPAQSSKRLQNLVVRHQAELQLQ